MSTRRQFIQSLPAVGTAFAVAGNLVLEDSPARAQVATVPLKEHFHPKGKAPSKYTLDVLKQAAAACRSPTSAISRSRRRGLSLPMKDLKIMADAGHVAWDMERFQFLDKQDEFDSIHPSLLRQSKLNNNYGLYEVIPGIYQVRGFDLSDITFVRGKTGWIVFDPLVTDEPVRAAWKLFQEHVGEGLAGLGRDLFAHAWRPLGRRARHRRRSGCEVGEGPVIAPVDFMDFTVSENVYAGNAMNRRLFYQYGLLLPASPHGYVGQGLGQAVSAGAMGLIAPTRLRRKGHRGIRGRRRPDDLPEHAEHRSASGDEHLHPRHEGALDGRERHRVAAQYLHAARRAGARSVELVEIYRRGALSVSAWRPR